MKKYLFCLSLFIALILFSIEIHAQVGYKIGDKVSPFSLTNAIDNSKVNLNDYLNTKAIVLIFTNTECPYSKLYEERLISMANYYREKNMQFILVNPMVGSDNEKYMESMSKRGKEKQYPFPFLADNKASVSNTFGATKTPEAFVLKGSNGYFYIAYKGAIDDNPQVANDVTHSYLKDALNDINSNMSIKISEKRPAGCMIPIN